MGGMMVDLFFMQGKDKTMLEDIYNSGGVGTFSIKLYEDGGSSNYIQFGTQGATSVFHNKASVNVPTAREGTRATTVIRLGIPLPENIIKDGFSSAYSGV